MEEGKMTVHQQAIEASRMVNDMIVKAMPPVPEGATVESLWKEICTLRGQVKKPKKVTAIRMLLEDSRLTGLPIPLIADIIKKVFQRAGLNCDTSNSSIRWYISQKTLDWNIKPRDKRANDVEI